MQRIHVTFLSPDDIKDTRKIWASYRQCYSSDTAPRLLSNAPDVEECGKFIRKCLAKGHTSPLEHVQLTFSIEGCSRVASHQLVRHRIASYSQQSQRYVMSDVVDKETYDLVFLPEDVDAWLKDTGSYSIFRTLHRLYAEMLEDGIKTEDARYILPEGSRTNIIMSINLRSFLNLCNLRLCDSAQAEIREVVAQMAEHVLRYYPWLKGYVAPKCFKSNTCLDGKYTKGVCSAHKAWCGDVDND